MYINKIDYNDKTGKHSIHLNVEGRSWSNFILTGSNVLLTKKFINDLSNACNFPMQDMNVYYDNLTSLPHVLYLTRYGYSLRLMLADRIKKCRLRQALYMLDDDMEGVQSESVKIDQYINILKLIYPEIEAKYKHDKVFFTIDGKIIPHDEYLRYYELEDFIASILSAIAESYINKDELFIDIYCIILVNNIDKDIPIGIQSKIMNILTTIFPRIQFIVSTDSPLVVKNAPNSVIYDLDSRISATNMSNMSYDTILKTWFKITD